jgi:hypothetical protein
VHTQIISAGIFAVKKSSILVKNGINLLIDFLLKKSVSTAATNSASFISPINLTYLEPMLPTPIITNESLFIFTLVQKKWYKIFNLGQLFGEAVKNLLLDSVSYRKYY